MLAAILPYSAAWLDKPELLTSLESFWGELTPEGGHWTAGPKRHAAISADGRALCLLMAVAAETTDTTEAIRQAMRCAEMDLSGTMERSLAALAAQSEE